MSGSHMDYEVLDTKSPKGKPEKVVRGHFPRAILETPTFPWFAKNYPNAPASKEDLEVIRAVSDELEVLVFLGTWCGDSHDHVPPFLKLMDDAHLPSERVVLIGLDRAKTLGTVTEQFKVERLPTFVFLANGSEIGRIVEKPTQSLVSDTIQILRRAMGSKETKK